MTFQISDPLILLSAQTGTAPNTLDEYKATADQRLQSSIEAIEIGTPIPIIFCRRRTTGALSHGGVYAAPKASEGYFVNNSTTNELTFKYLLVVSDGQLPLLQVQDVYQRTCRVGDTFNQAYNARAGTWSPENNIDVTPPSGEDWSIWRTPSFVGTGGSYSGLTTFSFEGTAADGDTSWSNQIFLNIKQGIIVTRLLGGTGSSDNYVDLAKYLIDNTERLGSELLDSTLLTIAANFVDANGFYFNGIVSASQNLQDWLEKTSINFLLRPSVVNGKIALKPRLPYNIDYTIKTTQITPEFTFTEDHIVPGGFEIEYRPVEDREPVCVTVLWRQQPENDFGLVRSTEIRYTGEAADGPYEQYDLSGFCTTEDHAIKIGVYHLATRKYVTHYLRLTVKEFGYNTYLTVGDLVRVRLRIETDADEVTYHDRVYEIERINKTLQGRIIFDLTHFPINEDGASVIALAVANATGSGNLITAGRGTFDCDVNNGDTDPVGTDTSVPSGAPPAGDTGISIDDPGFLPLNEPIYPGPGATSNPADPIEADLNEPGTGDLSSTGDLGEPLPGDTLSIAANDLACPDARVCWYRVRKGGLFEPGNSDTELLQCQDEPIAGNYFISITTSEIDYTLVATGECKDPSTPDGYGEATILGETSPVVVDTDAYTYARWTGTIYSGYTNTTTTYTSPWRSQSAGYFLTIGPAFQATITGCTPIDEFPLGGWELPPIGPIPWRATVRAIDNTTATGGLGLFMGSLGYNLNNNPCSLIDPYINPSVGMPNTPATGVVYIISGKWQFSDDQSTIEAEWLGDTDSSGPEAP